MEVAGVAPPAPRQSRRVASALASLAFLILITGVSYFAILVFAVHGSEGAVRAAAYRELGQFLSGALPWYQDPRVYGALSLLLALASLLFGVHRLARITLPVAGAIYIVVHFFGEPLRDLLFRWATQ